MKNRRSWLRSVLVGSALLGAFLLWRLSCEDIPSDQYELQPSLSDTLVSMQPVSLGDDAATGDSMSAFIEFRRRTAAVEPASYLVIWVSNRRSWLNINESAPAVLVLDGTEHALSVDPEYPPSQSHDRSQGDPPFAGLYKYETIKVVIDSQTILGLSAAQSAEIVLHGQERNARGSLHPHALRALQSFVRDHSNR